MSNSEPFVSARLQEVWAWKQTIYDEVAHLPTEQALREIGEKARIAAQKYNLTEREPVRGRSGITMLKP